MLGSVREKGRWFGETLLTASPTIAIRLLFVSKALRKRLRVKVHDYYPVKYVG